MILRHTSVFLILRVPALSKQGPTWEARKCFARPIPDKCFVRLPKPLDTPTCHCASTKTDRHKELFRRMAHRIPRTCKECSILAVCTHVNCHIEQKTRQVAVGQPVCEHVVNSRLTPTMFVTSRSHKQSNALRGCVNCVLCVRQTSDFHIQRSVFLLDLFHVVKHLRSLPSLALTSLTTSMPPGCNV